jgi:hypothetical protein
MIKFGSGAPGQDHVVKIPDPAKRSEYDRVRSPTLPTCILKTTGLSTYTQFDISS